MADGEQMIPLKPGGTSAPNGLMTTTPPPATAAPPAPAMVPFKPGGTSELNESTFSRTLSGIGESLKNTFIQPAKMIFTPPQDATEHAIAGATHLTPGGSIGSVAAYRMGKQIVTAADAMLKAPAENFFQAKADFAKAVEEFRKGDYRNAIPSGGSVASDVVGMMPGMGLMGQMSRELAEGGRPGGNLAEPLARDLTDLATIWAGEKALPAIGAKTTASWEKSAEKISNGLLRAKQERNFLYGKNPGRALLRPGITATNNLEELFDQLNTQGRAIDNELQTQLNSIRGLQIDIVPIVDKAWKDGLREVQAMRGLKEGARLRMVAGVNNLRDELIGIYDQRGNLLGRATSTKYSPGELNGVKRSLGKSIGWDALEKDPEVLEFMNDKRKQIYGRFIDRIEGAATFGLADSVKKLNAAWGDNIEARRLLAKRLAAEGMNDVGLNNLLAKSELFIGAARALHGDVLEGAALLANRAARTPYGRIARARFYNEYGAPVGAAINRVGRAISTSVGAGALSRGPENNE